LEKGAHFHCLSSRQVRIGCRAACTSSGRLMGIL
jgi:hypothetical protein